MKLTLVVAAVFAAALLMPGSALATPTFESASANAIISGQQGTTNVLSFPSSKSGTITFTCSEGAFSGTLEGSSSEELSLHPVYNKEEKTCENNVGLGKTKVTTTGCNYKFYGPPGSLKLTMCGTPVEAKSTGCTVKFDSSPSGGLSKTGYTNESEVIEGKEYRTFRLTPTISGIHYTSTGFGCSLAGIPAEGTNGKWETYIPLKGYVNEGGGSKGPRTSIWVMDPSRAFYTNVAPATVKGASSGTGLEGPYFHFLESGAYLECELTFNGEMGESTPNLTLSTQYYYGGVQERCGGPAPLNSYVSVKPNGCTNVFGADQESKSIWAGTISLTCPEGKKMEIVLTACTVSLPPQGPVPGVTYTNESGVFRSVSLYVSSTLTYTSSGWHCYAYELSNEGEVEEVVTKADLKSYANGSGKQGNLWWYE